MSDGGGDSKHRAPIEVLKFGSSVLRTSEDLPVAVDEIYRRLRAGCRVLAVVSAFEGETDRLIGDAVALFGSDSPDGLAAYVSTGEQRTAALLTGSLHRAGIPARFVDPRDIGLLCSGTCLESIPVGVDVSALEALWRKDSVLVLPGFYGNDAAGRIALLGRGGSDLSALFIAAELGAHCRLLKDVRGVFDADPARNTAARRFSSLTWESAVTVAGPLIQSKALRYARSRSLSFEVGRPNGEASTAVGVQQDRWADPASSAPALRIALLGCGHVGRGVYETIKRHPERFEVCRVLIRDAAKHADVPEATTDPSDLDAQAIDVVIECMGGSEPAHPLLESALRANKFVITANKAVLAAHWQTFEPYARGADRRLWFSAAVGGALPILETLSTIETPVREIRGILNGTCGSVLDALAAGRSLDEAVATAQAAGFAEANPQRDLSGRDSADKLALLIEAAFGAWLAPEKIPTRGIETISSAPAGYKLIARACKDGRGITASVGPEHPSGDSFLGQARGPENRVEIELANGEIIQLRGQGAGRWPTTVSVLGDLHEVARRNLSLRQLVQPRVE